METKTKAPILLIIFSALSFIPMIGVFFGIISIIIGLVNFTRFKLIFILGISGIGFTLLIYGSIYLVTHNLEKSGKFNELREQTTEMFLNNLSNELENYKCKNGSYPDSLEQISKFNSTIVITDMFNKNNHTGQWYKKVGNKIVDNSTDFYYKLDKDKFILFSVGKDGMPFTNDDIFPHDKNVKPFGK